MKQNQRLLARKAELEKRIQILNDLIKQCPQGKLALYTNNKTGVRWFRQFESNKKKPAQTVYLPKENKELAQKLAIKTYYLKMLEDAEEELKAIEAYIHVYDMGRKKQTYFSSSRVEELLAHPGYLELLPERLSEREKKTKEWIEEEYKQLEDYQSDKKIQVNETLFVRSKSEAIIAQALEQAHIPYRYECELIIENQSYYPDFTIRHPKTGEIFYWEHMGMMNSQSYATNAFKKLTDYSKAKIYPMRNLILTSEDQEKPLNPNLVYSLIEYYFMD